MAIAVFFIAAAVAILGGVGVVSFHQPIRSVLSLVLVMLALSVIFLLLVAAIGAIYLSRKRIDESEGGPAEGLRPSAGVEGNLPPHQT